MKYLIKQDSDDMLMDFCLAPVFIWLTMLAIGALGHYLHVPFLFKFNYFNTLLLFVATYPLRGSRTRKWTAEKQ